MTRELTAATEHAGVRLDAFLSADGALTRSQAARLIAEGRVRVNGKPAAKSARLSGGETVTVDVPQLRETALPPQDIPLDVVYEDDDVIVVNKPSGLVVHPAPGHPDRTLVNALLYHCGDSLSGVGGALRPVLLLHIVERQCQIQPAGILRLAHCAPHHLQQRPQTAGPLDAAVKGHLASRCKKAEEIFAGGVLHLVEHCQRELAPQHFRLGVACLRYHPRPRPQQQCAAGADQERHVPALDRAAAA